MNPHHSSPAVRESSGERAQRCACRSTLAQRLNINAIAAASALVAILLVVGCATPQKAGPREVRQIMPGVAAGYLRPEQLPDSAALLPPPPAADSAAFANDEAIHRRAQALRDTPRWTQAASDADLGFPHAAGTFDCALGIAVDPASTPRLYQLVQRTMVDAGLATGAAKHRYERTRPFVAHDETTCLPKDEASLRHDGSYPSGHNALGWAAALVLVEVAPERTDALLARGRSFGESRLVCNAHWQSDVIEGRNVAAAVVARLHAVPEFEEDLALARKELAAARASKQAPKRDCGAEAAALEQSVPGVL